MLEGDDRTQSVGYRIWLRVSHSEHPCRMTRLLGTNKNEETRDTYVGDFMEGSTVVYYRAGDMGG